MLDVEIVWAKAGYMLLVRFITIKHVVVVQFFTFFRGGDGFLRFSNLYMLFGEKMVGGH